MHQWCCRIIQDTFVATIEEQIFRVNLRNDEGSAPVVLAVTPPVRSSSSEHKQEAGQSSPVSLCTSVHALDSALLHRLIAHLS